MSRVSAGVSRGARTLVAATGLVALVGCGKPGAPLPPLRKSPKPITDVSLAQRGERIEVAYRVPRATLDDQPLPVLEIEIQWASAAGDFKKVAHRQTRKAAPNEQLRDWLEPAPPVGAALRVALVARGEGSPSAPTAMAVMVVQPPPAPPLGLTVEVGAAGARLGWLLPTPPATESAAPAATPVTPSPSPAVTPPPLPAAPAASPVATPTPPPGGIKGYWIYRRKATGSYDDPIVQTLTSGNSYADAGVTDADAWCYVVRAVVSTQPIVESGDSDEVCTPAAASITRRPK